MRLFLYNYSVDGNWEITRDRRVVGVPSDNTGMVTKVERDLGVGDIVVIRDNTFAWSDCRIFGACLVAGPVMLQRAIGQISPWEDLLWADEKRMRRIIYPFRFQVELCQAPIVRRKRVPWDAMNSVPAVGKHGQPIQGKQQWIMKWRGNLLDDPIEVAAMCEVLGLSSIDRNRPG